MQEELTKEQFEALPLNKQRIMIANDIISRVMSGFYQAQSAYCNPTDNVRELSLTDDVQSHFDAFNGCGVCAYGSVILSTTFYRNELKVDDVISSKKEADKLLMQIFSVETLTLIENAFELRFGAHMDSYINFGWRFLRNKRERTWRAKQDLAIDFGAKYNHKKDRLIAIMINVANNNGEFVV